MRIIAFIFSFYVLLLAVYPAFGNTAKHCQTSSCQQKQNCPKQNSPKRNCTPLFGCPYIQITTNEIEEPDFAIAPVFGKYFDRSINSYTLLFLKAPWHPPKS
jgi:hypothetical protein